MGAENQPKVEQFRVQLEVILDAVETDEYIEIIHSTANIEGSSELTTEMGLDVLHGALVIIKRQVTRAGRLDAHLSDDPTDADVLTLIRNQD